MKRFLLLSLLCAACFVPAQATQLVMYGITDLGALFTINPTTGVTTSAGSIAATNISYLGLSWNGTDLYALGVDTNVNTAALYRLSLNSSNLNATLASTIALGSALLPGSSTLRMSEGDFTFDTATTGYISSQGTRYELFRFNTATNSTASIVSCTAACPDGISRLLGLDGLYFNSSNNTLYGTQVQTTSSATTLDTVNTTTGARTQVGVTNIPVETTPRSYGGLTKDPISNVFYALNSSVGTTGNLYTVNSTTGQFTTIAALSGDVSQSVTGIAFATLADPPVPGIPEPGTVSGVLAALGLFAWHRSRGKK